MMVFLSRHNITMSSKKIDRGKVVKPYQRQLGQSKTTSFKDCDDKPNNEGSISNKNCEKQRPSSQPTLFCQTQRHVVSPLLRIEDINLEEIGFGFFADVYKATHKVTGAVMVLKVNKDEANRSSALREIKLLSKFSHPNILRYLGVCVSNDQLHPLTEFIGGGTLEALLANKNEELPWMLRIKLALDIALGMHYLHMEGVIHRDLTSRNILIKKGVNKNYQAVIADFGLAIPIPDPRETEPLPPVGCPWWMAPEVINNKFYNESADLFSYGIILLEMTARIESDPATMPRTKNFGVDYVKLCDLVEYCPLDFLLLAFKCCQILPDRRPNSCVIKITLERLYKSLYSDTRTSSEKLHTRTKSENDIIQKSDCSTDTKTKSAMTPKNVAEAMTKDDPDYCPAVSNPFANISEFKDGRKVHEFSRQRKHGSNITMFDFSKECVALVRSSDHADCWSEKQASQSLPSSPIMLRKAAEKMHLASLLGSEALQKDKHSTSNFKDSAGCQNSTELSYFADIRTHFSSNRTKSLGNIDIWSPGLGGPGTASKSKGCKCRLCPINSEKMVSGYQVLTERKESTHVSSQASEFKLCTKCQVANKFLNLENNLNINCTVSTVYQNLNEDDVYQNLNEDDESRISDDSTTSLTNAQAVEHEICEDSLNTSNMSSCFSLTDTTEEEDTSDIFSDSSVPYLVKLVGDIHFQ